MQAYRYPPLTPGPGDRALEEILRHIAVPDPVLNEARARRDLVLRIAAKHPAYLRSWNSGSIAQGTHNSPLGDADCGAMVDRRSEEFRAFGPDAPGAGKGPEAFIQTFAALILPEVRANGYPNAELDLTGNRAIKIEFNAPVDIDELGTVDPSVDLIVGLDRREADGIWIPNRAIDGWDAAHPQKHTKMMLSGPADVVVARAHFIRLSKRAIKRDGLRTGTPVLCSWNVSALALDSIKERVPLARGLTASLGYASKSIAEGLTEDPAEVADPIKLPDGMTHETAAQTLEFMAAVIAEADQADSLFEARTILTKLFGVEIEEIRSQHVNLTRKHPLNPALRSGNHAAAAAALGVAEEARKTTRSHGGR